MGHHQPFSPLLHTREHLQQPPNPLSDSSHSPEALHLPSRPPTMAWVLAQHGSDDISGAHVINHHIEMTVHTTTDTPFNTNVTPTSPSHSAHTAQLGRLEKISPTMRQHSSKQIIVHQAVAIYVTTDPKHSHCIEFAPLASPVESSKIRTTCAARLSNIFRLFSNTNPEQRRQQRLSPGCFDIKLTSKATARPPSCSITHRTL